MRLVCFFVLGVAMSMSGRAQQGGFYYLKVTSSNADVRCYLNGFPVYNVKSLGEITNQTPVNLSLIGENNQLRVTASPVEGRGKVTGTIAFYNAGEVVGTDDVRPSVASFELDVYRSTEKTISFDNAVFDFSETLQEPPVITKTSQLNAFGVKLIGFIKDKNLQQLLEVMKPKLKDYAKAYSAPEQAIQESLESTFKEGLFGLSFADLRQSDIVPVSYCEGRVWELRTRDGHTLIHAKEGDGEISLPVFVAMIDGELRIVR